MAAKKSAAVYLFVRLAALFMAPKKSAVSDA
jgi:hypothetical protein